MDDRAVDSAAAAAVGAALAQRFLTMHQLISLSALAAARLGLFAIALGVVSVVAALVHDLAAKARSLQLASLRPMASPLASLSSCIVRGCSM